ncbi:hypothetical protein BDZ94DRAFT_1071208 [Collybia nuda]|uniref:Uncharacterized protein n=1 Tax=Collybia nuda TaxID=64659 RepID=A0A9P6CFE9_9AGAR|nr:hypothetical protein BDZ94DRAFT_1071208 [Collybia nuda]
MPRREQRRELRRELRREDKIKQRQIPDARRGEGSRKQERAKPGRRGLRAPSFGGSCVPVFHPVRTSQNLATQIPNSAIRNPPSAFRLPSPYMTLRLTPSFRVQHNMYTYGVQHATRNNVQKIKGSYYTTYIL